MRHDDLTIRHSREGDSVALGRLAQLDSTLYDGSPALVAQAGDRMVAAVTLEDGASFADPFERSAEAVALLELRRKQIKGAVSGSRRAARRRRRFRAPASA